MEECKDSIVQKHDIPEPNSVFQQFSLPYKIPMWTNNESAENQFFSKSTQLFYPSPIVRPTFYHMNPIIPQQGETVYSKLKLRGEIYNVGETVLIRESQNSNLVARIEKIIKENGDPMNPTWPMIEVTWYF